MDQTKPNKAAMMQTAPLRAQDRPLPPSPAVQQEPHPLSLNPRAARSDGRGGVGRAERVPLGSYRQKLTAPERAGFHRRWINDNGDRIVQAEAGGYQFVEDERDRDEAGRGVKRFMTVGVKEDGSPLKAYLMEIRQEFFDEDQKAKQSKIDEVEAAIKRGKVESEDQSKFYVPTEGISIRS